MSLAGAPVAISAHRAGQPDGLRALLTGARTIAVVGASDEPWRPSFGIMRYLQRAGYKIIPVNPFLSAEVCTASRSAPRCATSTSRSIS